MPLLSWDFSINFVNRLCFRLEFLKVSLNRLHFCCPCKILAFHLASHISSCPVSIHLVPQSLFWSIQPVSYSRSWTGRWLLLKQRTDCYIHVFLWDANLGLSALLSCQFSQNLRKKIIPLTFLLFAKCSWTVKGSLKNCENWRSVLAGS